MRLKKGVLIVVLFLVAGAVILGIHIHTRTDSVTYIETYELSLEGFSKIFSENDAVNIVSDDGLVELFFPAQAERMDWEDGKGYQYTYRLEENNSDHASELYAFYCIYSDDGEWSSESILEIAERNMGFARGGSKVDEIYTKGREMIRYRGSYIRYGDGPDAFLIGRAFSIGNKLYMYEIKLDEKYKYDDDDRYKLGEMAHSVKYWAFLNGLTIH